MGKRLWREQERSMFRICSHLNSKCSEVYEIAENMTNINTLILVTTA